MYPGYHFCSKPTFGLGLENIGFWVVHQRFTATKPWPNSHPQIPTPIHLSFVYFMPGLVDPVHSFSLYGGLPPVSGFADSFDGSICFVVPVGQHQTQSFVEGHLSFSFLLVLFVWWFGFSRSLLFRGTSCVFEIFSFVKLSAEDREHTRFRKFTQVQQNKFVLAEVALRFWNKFDNFWMWSIFPLFTDNPNFWALEQALIQLWQPRLNTPFIYQFFNCRKGLIVQRPFSSSRQFGTFSLCRKLRWASTPRRIRDTFFGQTFHDRTKLWEFIQHLSSNSLRRFQREKGIRSHEFGLHPKTGQQPWWASTFLCVERHWPCYSILEGQRSSSTNPTTCSLASFADVDQGPTPSDDRTHCPEEYNQVMEYKSYIYSYNYIYIYLSTCMHACMHASMHPYIQTFPYSHTSIHACMMHACMHSQQHIEIEWNRTLYN